MEHRGTEMIDRITDSYTHGKRIANPLEQSQHTKNVPLGTLFLWEAGGICRCKDRLYFLYSKVF
jgi:hypothetical protein